MLYEGWRVEVGGMVCEGVCVCVCMRMLTKLLIYSFLFYYCCFFLLAS